MRDRITLRQLLYTDEWNGNIIYFIGSLESRKIKIGKSSNIQFVGRLGGLQTASPDKLIVFGIIKGGTRKEVSLHAKFAQSHYRGEWFDLTDDIIRFIESETIELVLPRRLPRRVNKSREKSRKALVTRKHPSDFIVWVRNIKNLHQVKEFLHLSWRELAEKIEGPNGRSHYSHSELIAWSNGERVIPEAAVRRVGQLMATALSQRYGREIGISLAHNSPWKVRPMIWCQPCQKWHELKRWNQKTHKEKLT